MAVIRDHIKSNTLLKKAAASPPNLGLQLFICPDDEQIPVDVRVRYFTFSDFKENLTEGTLPRRYADVFFAQELTPDKLMIARWVKTATKPHYLSGPQWSQVVAAWQAITAGALRFLDDALPANNSVDVPGIDFSGITAVSQVPTVIKAKLAALVTPAIVGLNLADVTIDALGRLKVTMPTAGSAQASIRLGAPPSGTDLRTMLDDTHSKSIDGKDVETPVAAAQAAKIIDPSYYNVHIRGASDAQAQALSAWIETEIRQLDLVDTARKAKDAQDTSALGYVLGLLNPLRTLLLYTEKDGSDPGGGFPVLPEEFPDAAMCGAVLPAAEGSKQFEDTPLKSVTDSGNPYPLEKGDRDILKARHYNVVEQYGDGTSMVYNGLTVAGMEKRILMGKDWHDITNAVKIHNAKINVDLMAFDNITMAALELIYRGTANEAVKRGIILNTKANPIVFNFPDADYITQAQRDTHTLKPLDPLYRAKMNTAIHDWDLYGVWEQ
jgi:hypothetical protein